jgi:trimeric autotransporter adhesin
MAVACTPFSALGQPCQPYWTSVGGASGSAHAAVVFDDGGGAKLYVGGRAPGRPPGVEYSASRWDGQTWESLDAGLPEPAANRNVVTVHVLDDGGGPRLYARGRIFVKLVGYVGWVRQWTGSGWSEAPSAMWDGGRPISFDDGTGSRIYGVKYVTSSQYGPARWDGAGWEFLGVPPFLTSASGMLLFGLDSGTGLRLHAFGGFTNIGGIPAHRFARWNGESWESVGTGDPSSIALRNAVLFDYGIGPMLHVADVFLINGQTAGRVVRWDGDNWSGLPGGGIANIGINAVYRLAVFDDGRGPALYIAGLFTQAGGVSVRNVVRFDGASYEPLGAGLGSFIEDMVVFNDGRGESLFIVGGFNSVGGGTSTGFAQWVGCNGQCYPNCDNSTVAPVVNVADFSCFLQKFAKSDPYANCNVDATIDIADFACFLQKFAAGCP